MLVCQWSTFVLAQNVTVSFEGRAVLFGDHTCVPKDAKRPPAISANPHDSYITNQETFNAVSSEMAGMLALELPFEIDLDINDSSLSGAIDYVNEWLSGTDQDRVDTVLINDSEHLRDFTNQIQNGVLDIQSEVDPFSSTYEKAQDLYQFH